MKRILFLFLLLPFVGHGQIITTCVGNGIGGPLGDGGPATGAELNLPVGLNFDNSGHLFICHQQLVRSVNFSIGIISTIAGSDTATGAGGGNNGGPATCAFILNPYAVSVDEIGNIYIADYWLSQVSPHCSLMGFKC